VTVPREITRFERIDPATPAHLEQVTALWHAACGDDLAISPRLAAYALRPSAGGRAAGVIAWAGAQPVGWVAASMLSADPAASPPTAGWIDGLAVTPAAQRRGVGSALLSWAEGWLVGQGCRRWSVGAGPRHLLPGLPAELASLGFFQHHGYSVRPTQVFDLAADLASYTPPPSVREVDAQVRPAQPGDQDALLTFLRREFPGSWRFLFEEHLRDGGRLADYMVLWTARGVDGCCRLTFGDSVAPIERYYPYRLPRPWGQLGIIGISADRRGQGLGAALLDAGLRRLHNNGVNGCIIDWTDLVDFYAKFGFTPHRAYYMLNKQI
jgi:GNAT superfamily N-acetyltransferase